LANLMLDKSLQFLKVREFGVRSPESSKDKTVRYSNVVKIRFLSSGHFDKFGACHRNCQSLRFEDSTQHKVRFRTFMFLFLDLKQNKL